MTSDLQVPAQHGRTLTEQVMDYVRSAVISGELKTDTLYSVYQLADRLKISRSPVRDGLLRLEEAGLVEFARNRGFRIIPTQPKDVAEIFSLRLALEVPAAFRAAQACTPQIAARLNDIVAGLARCAEADLTEEFFDLDQQLHDFILEVAQSNRGRNIVNRLRVATRLLGVSTAGKQRTLGDIMAEHEPIITAISSGNAPAAALAMRQHLVATGKLLLVQAVQGQGLDLDPEDLWTELTAGY